MAQRRLISRTPRRRFRPQVTATCTVVFVLFACAGVSSARLQATSGIGHTDFEAANQHLDARTTTGEPVLLSLAVGTTLDLEDRERYHLFPDVAGFRSAYILAYENDYRLEVTVTTSGREQVLRREISAATLRHLRLHLWLADAYQQRREETGPMAEEERLWLVALRYASLGRYELVIELLQDLSLRFADTQQGLWATDYLPDIRQATVDSRLPVYSLSLANEASGMNDMRLFGGYYGLWLGIAVPIALEADEPETFGLGLLAGGPGGWTTAAALSRSTDMTEGRASIIALGGWLDTWQAIGWSSIGESREGHTTVGHGVLGGLAGIGAAAVLTSEVEFTEGHGDLTRSAMPWGAWFGTVIGVISDQEDDDLLRSALLGSDALVVVTALTTKGSALKEKQVRLVNLAGLIGGVMGLGVTLITQPDDAQEFMTILGLSSLTGLVVGYRSRIQDTASSAYPDGSRDQDSNGAAAGRFSLPRPMAIRNLGPGDRLIPALGLSIGF